MQAVLPRSAAERGHRLTSEDVLYISPVKLGKRNSEFQERRITAKVKAALDGHFMRDVVGN
jgi:hypothetical protein